jgi:hypothetical protein
MGKKKVMSKENMESAHWQSSTVRQKIKNSNDSTALGTICIVNNTEMEFAFFWVNPQRLCVSGRCFRTHYQFHLHRQVNQEYRNGQCCIQMVSGYTTEEHSCVWRISVWASLIFQMPLWIKGINGKCWLPFPILKKLWHLPLNSLRRRKRRS